MREENRSNRWRYVPLATGFLLLLFTVVTFGAGIVFAPAGVVMTIVSARRLASPRGSAYWFGAALCGVLMLGLAVGMVTAFAAEFL